ncbi:MAG TPA: hypothetical protein VK754_13885 [Propionibacteriaceae bacterium]|nr:hypothetical protein [Propionibacteriaceae bacterium]
MLFSGRSQATLFDWPSDVQQMIAEDDLVTSTLLRRGTDRTSVMGDPPIGRNVAFCGQDLPHRRRQGRRALATRTVS